MRPPSDALSSTELEVCCSKREITMIRAPLDDPTILKKFKYYVRLTKLSCYVSANLSERLQLDDAARVACMEKTAFSRFFSRTVGITFHDFLQQWRVAVAV